MFSCVKPKPVQVNIVIPKEYGRAGLRSGVSFCSAAPWIFERLEQKWISVLEYHINRVHREYGCMEETVEQLCERIQVPRSTLYDHVKRVDETSSLLSQAQPKYVVTLC